MTDSMSTESLVGAALEAARIHDSPLELADIAELLPHETTTEELLGIVSRIPGVDSSHDLRGDFVFLTVSGLAAEDLLERRRTSESNITTARWLADKLRASREPLAMAVSGSTSYRSATKGDDVDLFCVTRPGTMWIFLAKSLIFTRMSRLFSKSHAPICLSCVVDEEYATSLFEENQGALFARDALAAEVVLGDNEYSRLLGSAGWICNFFPRLYSSKLSSLSRPSETKSPVPFFVRIKNDFLYVILGTYIRAKARFHNHLLWRSGKSSSRFHAKVGRDHLIYESAKYLKLKETYSAYLQTPESVANGARSIQSKTEM